MTNDLHVFWRNNEHAAALFYDLVDRAERSAYDDDFLVRLADYREAACPSGGSRDSVNADIFAAQYLLHEGDAENALACGERAYAQRSVNLEVWKVLAAAYAAAGRDLEALTMQGYMHGLYPSESLSLTVPEAGDQRAALDHFSLAANHTAYVPLLTDRVCIKNDVLQFEPGIFLGEEIPLRYCAPGARHWVGTYVDEGFLSAKALVYEPNRHDPFFFINDRDVTFDLQKAREATGAVRIDLPEDTSVVLPVAGTRGYQDFSVQNAAGAYPGYLGKWAFSYLRLDESATLRSDDAPFAVGTPIRLGHRPHRRKVVLNLLIDGMCRPAVRPLFAEYMPRIARFFARGVIFENHFSVSEYTLPSLPSIETGRYPYHTQVFNEKHNHVLLPSIRTLAEEMSDLGYYCTAPLATGQLFYAGVYRGYDRIISTHGFQPAYEGAERALRILEALPTVDHFMLYHTGDVHPLNTMTPLKFSTAAEVAVPLAQRFVPLDPQVASVRIPYLPIFPEQLRVSLRHIDRSVGAILSYIEEHYEEDEYIVNLYSDHGYSLFDPHPAHAEVLGAYATGAVWMVRGAGVPEGVVTDELTSSVDLYPTLAHLCGFPIAPDIDGNLPAVFGGRARDAALSMSIFPGQTFKLAVRSHEHALRVETQGFVDEDGTADFADAKAAIYPRAHELEEGYEVDSPALRAFFWPRAREIVHEIANNGERWPAMRAARPQWFGADKEHL